MFKVILLCWFSTVQVECDVSKFLNNGWSNSNTWKDYQDQVSFFVPDWKPVSKPSPVTNAPLQNYIPKHTTIRSPNYYLSLLHPQSEHHNLLTTNAPITTMEYTIDGSPTTEAPDIPLPTLSLHSGPWSQLPHTSHCPQQSGSWLQQSNGCARQPKSGLQLTVPWSQQPNSKPQLPVLWPEQPDSGSQLPIPWPQQDTGSQLPVPWPQLPGPIGQQPFGLRQPGFGGQQPDFWSQQAGSWPGQWSGSQQPSIRLLQSGFLQRPISWQSNISMQRPNSNHYQSGFTNTWQQTNFQPFSSWPQTNPTAKGSGNKNQPFSTSQIKSFLESEVLLPPIPELHVDSSFLEKNTPNTQVHYLSQFKNENKRDVSEPSAVLIPPPMLLNHKD